MLGLILVVFAAQASCDIVLQALNSRTVFTSLLSSHLSSFHQEYPKSQLRLRATLFRANLQQVADCNKHQHYECAINQFSTMTAEERAQYTGLANATLSSPTNALQQPLTAGVASPDSLDWRQHGAVTPVQNQASCGSCWAFSATAAMEGQYAITGAASRKFSEQEVLECSYENKWANYNGCGGGWMYDAFDYVKGAKHLSLAKDKPYKARDDPCSNSGPSGLVAAEVDGYVKVATGDDALAGAIAITPVSVAMLSTGKFFSYSKGVYDGAGDCSAGQFPNHALTGVAYTRDTFVIKNSWGDTWGDKGYITLARGYDVCRVASFVYYPTMKVTGDIDGPTQAPAPIDKCADPVFDDNCRDENTRDCPGLYGDGRCFESHMFDYTFKYCKKSCFFCNNIPLQDLVSDCAQRIADSSNGCKSWVVEAACPKSCCKDDGGDPTVAPTDDNDGCPNGTTLCPDGTCKHVHMC